MGADDSPYVAFLRDTFRIKVALLLGWPLPLQGHVARALRQAWQVAQTRGPTAQPIAYLAFAGGVPEDLRQSCLHDFGLEVICCPNSEALLVTLSQASTS